MRPPMASDHHKERKLRIIFLKKHAPYNSGEERGLPESIARRYCVLGVAVPSPKKDGIKKVNPETGETEIVEDTLGGWFLSPDEEAAARQLDKAKKEAAGDYKREIEDDEHRAKAEESRVETAASKEPEKPGGFLRGAGKKGNDAKARKNEKKT